MRNFKNKKQFVLLFLLGIVFYSCSKDEQSQAKVELQNNENFVELTQAKEIGGDIYFSSLTSAKANKGGAEISSKRTIKTITEAKNDNGKTSYYIINYNEGGFILLSADNRIQPILAYSEEGRFEIDETAYSEGLQFWTNDTKMQISEIQNSKLEQSSENKIAWEKIQNILTNQNLFSKEDPIECYDHTEIYTVGPFLNSKWYQDGGFNDALPYISCGSFTFQVYAGCVPIAMGQVMKYYQYPTNYNWSFMPLTSATTTTANFIADIHTAINDVYSDSPIYSCTATSVYPDKDMGYVLRSQFGYSSASYANYNSTTVRNNLNLGKPVILAGDNGNTGHMWVCDGYRDTAFHFADCTGALYQFLHMNWGFGDNNDGWFALGNFNPGNTHYNYNKKMIYNITP